MAEPPAAAPVGISQSVGELRLMVTLADSLDDRVELLNALCAAVRAEAVADERQQLAEAILPDHWQTVELWGGVQRLACGRCRHGDGVRFLWPCPTRRAITGEPEPEPDSTRLAAGSVPVATPEPDYFIITKHPDGSLTTAPGPVATPTEPAERHVCPTGALCHARHHAGEDWCKGSHQGAASPVPAERPEPRGVGGHAPGCDGWRPPTALGFGQSVPSRCIPGCPHAAQPEGR